MDTKIIVVDSEQLFKKSTALRLEVFTQEQNFDPAIELDEYDVPFDRKDVMHIIAVDSQENALATVRLYLTDGQAHLGRLAVAKQARGTGLGRAICEYAVHKAIEAWSVDTVVLSSQHQVRKFYEGLGYVYNEKKGYYDDEGWQHCEMAQTFSKQT
ncbi:acyl-CoA N-acyltransferase [Protomyces lactucae-debilis]|uniref:Glucosamine 6-phosphate N-acetyltransferase n=1 Tax=Protomyces lactucae-debilis TaxID=2754530 RepID=A0A1Y2FS88_PROLT|nr:acyl-CoA N-acyltransferase [Protomyces lactucae-debilis]ORY86819.1 acyl-CoA N-acyltransferase [Protomyces lactucae-debilis]